MRAAALLCALAAVAPLQDDGDPAAEAERLFEIATEGSPRVRSQASLRLAALGETGAALVLARLERITADWALSVLTDGPDPPVPGPWLA